MTSELVLLFDTKHLDNVLEQLDKAFDEHSVAGQQRATPSLIVCRKYVWLKIEKELQKRIEERYITDVKATGRSVSDILGVKPKRYDVVTEKGLEVPGEGKSGFNALVYRGRPVVAIAPGDNVIAARVGANS